MVTVCVTVAGGTDMVTVTGGGVLVAVTVIMSVITWDTGEGTVGMIEGGTAGGVGATGVGGVVGITTVAVSTTCILEVTICVTIMGPSEEGLGGARSNGTAKTLLQRDTISMWAVKAIGCKWRRAEREHDDIFLR